MRHLTHRSDANQQAIINALRRIGATVVDLQNVGNGCPDLLVGYRGRSLLLEVKSKTGQINKRQQAFYEAWRGDNIIIVRSPFEAVTEVMWVAVKEIIDSD